MIRRDLREAGAIDESTSTADEAAMELALEQAGLAFDRGEVPVGAREPLVDAGADQFFGCHAGLLR